MRGDDVVLNPSSSVEFVLPASRAGSEMLRNHTLELRGMGHMRDWQEALDAYLNRHSSYAKQAT
jgi:dTDP-4-dehydrorhamnose reductase